MSSDERVPVPGFGGRYHASPRGLIFGPSGKSIGHLGADGYRFISAYVDGRCSNCSIHRLIALTFLGEPDGREIDHINGVRDDNRLCNLRYCTRAENNRFTAEAGRGSRGENHARARFTEDEVRTIRQRYAQRKGRGGPDSLRAIAADYGCGFRVIYHITSGATWAHVT